MDEELRWHLYNNGNEVLTYNECLERVGGFGRYQCYIATTLILAFMTGGQIVYGLEYLEIYPDYYCYDIRTGEWDTCDR